MRPSRSLYVCLGAAALGLWMVFGLFGCAAAQNVRAREIKESFSPYYSAGLSLSSPGLEIAASLSRPGPDSCTVEVTAPDSIKGLRYTLRQDGVDISYRELTFTALPPAASPLLAAADALSSLLAAGPEPLPTLNGGFWELEGDGCKLLLEEESGLPVKLLLLGGEVEIILENFVFYG